MGLKFQDLQISCIDKVVATALPYSTAMARYGDIIMISTPPCSLLSQAKVNLETIQKSEVTLTPIAFLPAHAHSVYVLK